MNKSFDENLHDNFLNILDGSYNFKLNLKEVIETLIGVGLNYMRSDNCVRFIVNEELYVNCEDIIDEYVSNNEGIELRYTHAKDYYDVFDLQCRESGGNGGILTVTSVKEKIAELRYENMMSDKIAIRW